MKQKVYDKNKKLCNWCGCTASNIIRTPSGLVLNICTRCKLATEQIIVNILIEREKLRMRERVWDEQEIRKLKWRK